MANEADSATIDQTSEDLLEDSELMGNGEDSEVQGDEFFSEFNHISIGLMDPDRVLEMSHGEIEKPETINYRTLRPERGGLFCEKIFGPTRDWECFCGKYKSKKYAGVVCDKCGVEVARSKVRRVRMGHINLMSPVAHIWFLKGIPSKISLVLDMKIKSLEKVVYYENYLVLDAGETELKEKELLSEQEYQRAREEFGNRFKADMGAAAVQELLENLDLESEIEAIEEELELSKRGKRAKLGQKNKNLIRRLRTLKGFYDSGIEPGNMISEVVPVIPPELRPMIQLERGRFATSDVNDLYRRVINRNNRLKKLQELRTPDIIIRNEKRMLQEAVDALIDNSRVDRPVRGPNNRPLKSLTDLLKGKQGRFRQNLLGKRVDYSGRAVIVNGPELNFNQCGLPKKMAVELFKPFIMQRLVNDNEAASIKSAKRMIEREESEVWDALEEVIQGHPVMLNRAPTLHRLGIQAYQPVLTEGHAIQLHPLQCPPFNADYDGDQMAVHVPLSKTAQIEARVLMMSTNNLLSPAHGGALSIPTQDMVIGLHYLTKTKTETHLDEMDNSDVDHVFGNSKEVEWAYESDAIELAEPILYRHDGNQYVTTAGRVIFNNALPEEMAFQNESYDEDGLADLVKKTVEEHGIYDAVQMLDRLKELGYHESTLMGGSISYEDLLKPDRKDELLEEGEQRVEEITDQYEEGNIVEEEKYNRVINVWHEITEEVSNDVFETMSKDMQGYNPVYMMADSGARGSNEQIRQLAGMRGLMAKPSGKIIELPIKSSFRDGLSVMEYFISTHGARKGLADTALKTADAGYLTRRLADVAQSVRITDSDCGTLNGLEVYPIRSEEQVLESIEDRIIGRVAREDIKHPQTGELLVEENEEIDEEAGRRIGDCGFDSIEIRSVLTCEAEDGVCAKCYGRDLSTRKIVDIGEPVGIIAAQSIGEPGTQLTMRTFHTGGTAAGGGEEGIFAEDQIYVEATPEDAVEYTREDDVETLVALTESELRLRRVNQSLDLESEEDDVELEPVAFDGLWVYDGDAIATKTVDGEEEEITADHEGIVNIKDDTLYVLGNEYTIDVGIGAQILYKEGEIIDDGEKYVEIDPYNELIVAEFDGTANLRDIEVGRTLSEEVDETTGMINKVITEDKQGNLFPSIVLKKDAKKSTRRYDLPYNSILEVEDGDDVAAGQVLAKMPRESVQTKDITGGLPRVEDLFEARKRTKESAKVAEISGRVEFIKEEKRKEKGVRTIEITNPETDDTKSYRVKPGVHIRVREGEHIEEGTPLTEGYINPHDLLRVRGVSSLQDYLVEEIQKVYLQQGISIDDKHVEVVVRQMLRRVMITEAGDTGFLPGERADRYRLARVNQEIQSDGGEPATFKPILQGITKASLETDSFISAASFQDTKRVLSDAACKGQIDELEGLKENVITGHLIPAGTGFESYRDMFKEDLRDVVEQARSFTREAAEEEETEEAEEGEEVTAG